jgi:hypothetical protein
MGRADIREERAGIGRAAYPMVPKAREADLQWSGAPARGGGWSCTKCEELAIAARRGTRWAEQHRVTRRRAVGRGGRSGARARRAGRRGALCRAGTSASRWGGGAVSGRRRGSAGG